VNEIIEPGERVEIPLYRGGSVVTSLPGALGATLRETRVTALLGYLISTDPDQFYQLFNFQGRVLTIGLETYHEHDRSDILIETTAGTVVIEAKIGATNPYAQAQKYKTRWRILITDHTPTSKEANRRNVKFVNWAQIGKKLHELTSSRDAVIKFVSDNLLHYMEAHNMVREVDSVEIYAREINEETTLRLFLKAHLYVCEFQQRSRLQEALYFAPHFGRWVARNCPGVNTGISYIAKIDTVMVVESWDEFLSTIKASRGKIWIRRHRQYLDGISKWRWRRVRRSIVFLETPRLVFNPPIKKTTLQSGSGWLSRRTFSFDELFQAWGK
jgi:hypothetical protein